MDFYLLVLQFARIYKTIEYAYSIAEEYWKADTGSRAFMHYSAFRNAKVRFRQAWPDVRFYIVRMRTKDFDAVIDQSYTLDTIKKKYAGYKGCNITIYEVDTDAGALTENDVIVYEKEALQ